MKPAKGSHPTIAEGTWVELELVILEAGERAPGIPADTASVPFAARVRGFLVAPAARGATAQVRTQADRVVSGKLRAVPPPRPDPHPTLPRKRGREIGQGEGKRS